MRINTTEFKGIIRTTSSLLSGEGACEELINVRHTAGKLAVVKRHKALFGNVDFTAIIEHRIGPLVNYIAILNEGDTRAVVLLEVRYDGDGEIITPAYTNIYSSTGQLTIKALNNLLVITDTTKDNLLVYEYADGLYKKLYDSLPPLPSLTITKKDYDGDLPPGLATTYSLAASQQQPVITKITELKYSSPVTRKYMYSTPFSARRDSFASELQYKETVVAAIKEARTVSENYSEGYFLLSLNFTLINGEETKMSNPVLIEIGAAGLSPIIEQIASLTGGTLENTVAAIKGQAVDIALENLDYSSYKRLIRNINIYTTEVLSHYDLDAKKLLSAYIQTVDQVVMYSYEHRESFLDYKVVNNEFLNSLLFFKQKEIQIDRLSDNVSLVLDSRKIVSEKTMKVDSSGWLKTTGKGYIYNSRLHLYDYSRTFTSEASIFNNNHYTKGTWNKIVNAQFKINATTGKTMYVSGTINALIEQDVDGYKVRLADLVAFPDSRAESLYIYFTVEGVVYAGTLLLEPSKAYNYAFAVIITSTTEYSLLCSEVVSADIQDNQYREEIDNVILVSSIGAPYHFPVEHSYPMPGRIKALSVMASQLSEAQQGQYPLFVFTDSGIYALQQGSGVVLYSNVIPVSNDISTGSVIQTKTGIAYIANNTVNLLYGRIGVSIANVLDGPPDTSIRFCNSFNLATKNIALYNISDYLSKVDFRQYVNGAKLFYDGVSEEIIVSNPGYLYSYVFNLREKLWHKITDTYKGVSGGKLALRSTIGAQQPALSATATIDISAIIVAEEVTFAPQNRCVIESANAVIAAGQQIQLIIDSSRISSYYTNIDTPLYMVLEAMLLTIPFMKTSYNSVTHTADIYTSKAEYNGKVLSVKNITANTLINEMLEVYTTSVTIARKGIGQTISATIAGITAQITILAGDDYTSITERLKNAITSAVATVTATNYLNVITISTKQTGAAQNNTTIAVSSSLHVLLRKSNFSGARDAGVVSLEDAPVDVVDLTQEELTGNAIIHIQTRPLMLGEYGYKKIERAILRGEVKPSGKPFGCYLFGSNDLETWKLVTGIQSDTDIVNMRMQRSKLSYRYYIIVAGGSVDLNSNIVVLEAEITDMIGNKIR
ncbi:MAG: hypothetical protein BGO30_06055 [Bacteroidetes bacterium 41-46]|nr:MAG: hypothetical protein BGO30_06055 [Bacteroidetes bacterium 41-46]